MSWKYYLNFCQSSSPCPHCTTFTTSNKLSSKKSKLIILFWIRVVLVSLLVLMNIIFWKKKKNSYFDAILRCESELVRGRVPDLNESGFTCLKLVGWIWVLPDSDLYKFFVCFSVLFCFRFRFCCCWCFLFNIYIFYFRIFKIII